MSRTCVDDFNNDVEGVFNGQALTCIGNCAVALTS